jgi:hypothetical protein
MTDVNCAEISFSRAMAVVIPLQERAGFAKLLVASKDARLVGHSDDPFTVKKGEKVIALYEDGDLRLWRGPTRIREFEKTFLNKANNRPAEVRHMQRAHVPNPILAP